jgi:protein-L-isoaspartate(D-aspartate) O-methyltransferase
MRLRRHGIGPAVLSALEAVPRRLFLDHAYQHEAYEELTLPIDCGEVIEPPALAARILQALELQSGHKVLDIGTGTGYLAALMGRLAGRVVTIDRYRTLIDLAGSRFATLRINTNITAGMADGSEGLLRHAPYDRIALTAAVPAVPEVILEQLTAGGILVAAVGIGRINQRLVKVVRAGRGFDSTDLGEARMLPLVAGVAARL